MTRRMRPPLALTAVLKNVRDRARRVMSHDHGRRLQARSERRDGASRNDLCDALVCARVRSRETGYGNAIAAHTHHSQPKYSPLPTPPAPSTQRSSVANTGQAETESEAPQSALHRSLHTHQERFEPVR